MELYLVKFIEIYLKSYIRTFEKRMPQLKLCQHVTSIKLDYMSRIFTKYFNPYSKLIHKYTFFPLRIKCLDTSGAHSARRPQNNSCRPDDLASSTPIILVIKINIYCEYFKLSSESVKKF